MAILQVAALQHDVLHTPVDAGEHCRLCIQLDQPGDVPATAAAGPAGPVVDEPIVAERRVRPRLSAAHYSSRAPPLV